MTARLNNGLGLSKRMALVLVASGFLLVTVNLLLVQQNKTLKSQIGNTDGSLELKPGSELPPIEGAVVADDRVAKAPDDRAEFRGAGQNGLAGEDVGVHRRHTRLAQPGEHVTLARRDAPGQRDFLHGAGTAALSVSPCRSELGRHDEASQPRLREHERCTIHLP